MNKMEYYNIEDGTVWTEEDMKEAYDAYVANLGEDSYEEWLDNMLEMNFEEIVWDKVISAVFSLEDKIRETINLIFSKYGADKAIDVDLKKERILNLCIKELTLHPDLFETLDTYDGIAYLVIQTILYDVSSKKVI